MRWGLGSGGRSVPNFNSPPSDRSPRTNNAAFSRIFPVDGEGGCCSTPWIMALALGGVDNAVESRGWILAALASPFAFYGAAVWAVRFFRARSEPQD